MKKYSLEQLIKIYSEFESTDWEAISTQEFLTFLFDLEEKEKLEKIRLSELGCLSDVDEGNSPFDSLTDAQADYMEEPF